MKIYSIMQKIYFCFFLFFISISMHSQKEYKIRTVAFYNLENLFDTINDLSKDDEYSPMMQLKEKRSEVYWDKVGKLSKVINEIGREKTKTSPAIIGVAEVENKQVLEDLVKSKKLQDRKYDIIHFDSPDKRGIDVALLYQSNYFKPIHYEVFNPNIYADNKKVHTRDILLVSGYLDDELIHVIVNHWPSRRGGQEKSNYKREKAAYKVTQIIEKIRENDKDAKIIMMGDFNDDPTNTSLKSVLKTKAKKENVKKADIFNPYEKMFQKGMNTLGHRDRINLFDQILITFPLLQKEKKEYVGYKMYKPGIFNKLFLTQNSGRYKGYPFRSFAKGQYTGGYSDHYPVYLYLIKDIK